MSRLSPRYRAYGIDNDAKIITTQAIRNGQDVTLDQLFKTHKNVRNQKSLNAWKNLAFDRDFANLKMLNPSKNGPQISFFRGGGATQIGSNGLVEWAPENLLPRSEEFNTAPWSALNGTATPTNVLDPAGGLAADSFIENTASGNHQIFQTLNTAIGVQTFSIFVKAAGRTSCQLLLFNGTDGGFARVNVDLSTGALSSVVGSASVQQFSNGWWRVSVTGTSTVLASSVNLLLVNGGTTSYLGNGASGVLLYGAQFQRGPSPTAYIRTTTSAVYEPRFTHDPVTGTSLGLLIEESRTNLVSWSEDFTNIPKWATLSGTVNRTGDFSVAPDGTTTADLLTFAATNATMAQVITTPIIVGAVYTGSIYVRNASKTGLELRVARSGVGVFESSVVAIPVSAEWQRISVTHTFANVQTAIRLDVISISGGTNATVEVWGAQLEAGSFASSYIPTSAAAVTRATDVCQITGTNFSSWFGQKAGTIVVNYAPPPRPFPSSSRYEAVFRFGPSATDRWGLVNGGSTANYQTQIYRNATFIGGGAAIPQSSSMAYAFAWDEFGHAQSYNGTAVTTGLLSPTTNVNTELLIGTSNLCGTIARILVHRSRLPDNIIRAITTSNVEIEPIVQLTEYIYTVTTAQVPDRRMPGQYFIVTNGSMDRWGIALGWDSGGEVDPVPGVKNFVIADPGDTSDRNFSPRIQSIVGAININSSSLGYTATFISGEETVGSFKIRPTNSTVRPAPTASVGTWATTETYVQPDGAPDGVSLYFQPDSVSYYFKP